MEMHKEKLKNAMYIGGKSCIMVIYREEWPAGLHRERERIMYSEKVNRIHSDIRGPIFEEAMRMQSAGIPVLKLNTGNPATFGFQMPDSVRAAISEGMDHYELPKYHDFNGITTPYGAHFVLRIDKILMKEQYRNAIVNGVRSGDFPHLPVDYGYRDSKNFWYHKHRRLLPELLPQRQTPVARVRYAADRLQTEVQFTDAALERLVKVPRVFLPTALKGCVKWAEENGVKVIDVAEMEIINDKRSKEKGK